MTNNDLTLTMLARSARGSLAAQQALAADQSAVGRSAPVHGCPVRAACVTAAEITLQRTMEAARKRLEKSSLPRQEAAALLAGIEDDARDWLARWIDRSKMVA